jgi:hypothetical protein
MPRCGLLFKRFLFQTLAAAAPFKICVIGEMCGLLFWGLFGVLQKTRPYAVVSPAIGHPCSKPERSRIHLSRCGIRHQRQGMDRWVWNHLRQFDRCICCSSGTWNCRATGARSAAAGAKAETSSPQVQAQGESVSGPDEDDYDVFYSRLSPEGSWIEAGNYGYCFRPRVARDW